MDAEIVKQNGETFRLSDFGIVYDFVVHSISMRQSFTDVDGRPGTVDDGAQYGQRRISVPMKFKAEDLHDYAHLRDVLYGKLIGTESFYIREMRRLNLMQYEFRDFGQQPKWSDHTDNTYVNGKQYLVRLESEITPEQLQDMGGEISLEFVTTELPFAESTYTTLELHDSGYSATAEKYGLVDNIDDEKVQYRFTDNNFTVYNAGNVTIEPESMMLNIFASYVESSGDFTIRNKTTGEEIILQRNSNGSHFRINGMVMSLGSITNIFRDTNRRFISLAPGDNEIEVTNGTFDRMDFDFRYLHK